MKDQNTLREWIRCRRALNLKQLAEEAMISYSAIRVFVSGSNCNRNTFRALLSACEKYGFVPTDLGGITFPPKSFRNAVIDECIKAAQRIEDEHPYKQEGKPDSYSEYAEAWSDACSRAITELEQLKNQ